MHAFVGGHRIDGELANALMHPSSNIEREYMVRVKGEVTEETLQRLRDGVMLEDGVARFTDIQDGGGEGKNHWYYVVIMEGRTREVRRLWESQDCVVSRLKRTRYVAKRKQQLKLEEMDEDATGDT